MRFSWFIIRILDSNACVLTDTSCKATRLHPGAIIASELMWEMERPIAVIIDRGDFCGDKFLGARKERPESRKIKIPEHHWKRDSERRECY